MPLSEASAATREVLVLGDSHAEVLGSAAIATAIPECRFTLATVGGVTVSGLPNPNSRTQGMARFATALAHSAASTAVVSLGEVDTGFVIWYRAEKYQQPLPAMLAAALANYQALLCRVAAGRTVICLSTPLPTISDDNDWGAIANLRREVRASQQARTALTLRFNRAMQIFCARQGFAYVMLDEQSLDANGLVRQSLRNRDPSNHHYDTAAYAALLIPGLRAALGLPPGGQGG